MQYIAYWIALPALTVLVSLGCGLLLQRAVPAVKLGQLTLPAGYAVAIVLSAAPYVLGLGSVPGAIWLLAITVLGFAAGRRYLADANPGWPGIAAAGAVYTLFMIPIVLSGRYGFLGYNLLGDTSVHFSVIDWISQHGLTRPSDPQASYQEVARSLLNGGYPLGQHMLLAGLRQIVTGELAWMYQPFISVTVALAALPAMQLIERAGIKRWWAALVAVLAVGAYLPYSYAMQGSVKEMAMIGFLATGALLAERAVKRPSWTSAVPFAIVTAAAYSVYSAGMVPWFGLIAVFSVTGTGMWRPRLLLTLWRPLVAALGVFVIAALPTEISTIHFYTQGTTLLGGGATGTDVGNLLGPVSVRESLGFWFAGDYRLGSAAAPLVRVMDILALALVVLGFYRCVRTRNVALAAYFLATLITWLVLPAGIYIEAKLIVLLSTPMVLLIAAGLVQLGEFWGRVPAIATAAVFTLALASSLVAVYLNVFQAPVPRLQEMRAIGNDVRGGPALMPDFSEYAKHFLRQLDENSVFESYAVRPAELRPGRTAKYAQWNDIDDIELKSLESYPLIVQSRSPAASRPPSNFKLLRSGTYYNVWQRQGSPQVLEHLALGRDPQAAAVPQCSKLRDLADRAEREGAELSLALRPLSTVFGPAILKHPANWASNEQRDLQPHGWGGHASGTVAVPAPGDYEIWLRGTLSAGADFSVDGKPVGKARGTEPAGGAKYVGSFHSDGETVTLTIANPSSPPSPGDRLSQVWQKVFITPTTLSTLKRVAPADVKRYCGKPLDWVEIVRG